MKKLVIFDLDGTLVDTIPDITQNVNLTLKEFGFKEREQKEILGFVNYGAEKLLRDAIGVNILEEDFQKAFSFYKQSYKNSTNENSLVYTGIYKLLSDLKQLGVILCVYSNKQNDVVQNIVNSKFNGIFDCATGQREGVKTKPDPAYILSLLDQFNVKKENAYMIGDGDTDIKVSVNAEIHSIGVSWGYRKPEILTGLGAEFIADTTDQILEYIKG